MAEHGIDRPAGPTHELFEPTSHQQWHADRWTGVLEIELTTLDHQWISPGTGRLGLATLGGDAIVAQKASRRCGIPVIPGTSIKGAVRTIFELLTDSCDPLHRPCKGHQCCPACTLFGRLGFRGRVSFDDAIPAAAAATASVAMTPVPRSPKAEKTEGDFRFYDLHRMEPPVDQPLPQGGLRPLAREVFTGSFVSRLRFQNLTRQALGALVISMGCSSEPSQQFPLRLGGVKYDGKGAVRVAIGEIRLAAAKRAERKTLDGDACIRAVSEWVDITNQRPWARRCRNTLAELCRVLNEGN